MVFATDYDPNDARRKAQAARQAAKLVQPEAHLQPGPARPPLPTLSAAERVALRQQAQPARVRPNASVSPLSLPEKPELPWGLSLLNRAQHYSAILTGVLVAGALVVYGSTVYVDKSTHAALTRLDTLQGESQQLTAASEAIKQNLATEAQQADSGLEPSESGDILFITPEAPRPAQAIDEPDETRQLGPIGY